MFQEIAAINLILQPYKTNSLPPWMGRAAQAFFLDSLRRVNAELSTAIHDGSTLKPFTVSTLFGGGRRSRDALEITPKEQVMLRYTTLHQHLSAVLVNGLIPDWCSRGVVLHDQPFSVSAVQMHRGESPCCGLTSFAALIEQASTCHRTIRLEFTSPTAFKATNGPFIPLPLPELVFSSLLDRWNRFSPLPLPESLYEVFARGIAIQHLKITTQDVRFGKGTWGAITGFTGQVTYHIEQDEEVRRAVNILVAFAPYASVGVKVTTGMGQVRVR